MRFCTFILSLLFLVMMDGCGGGSSSQSSPSDDKYAITYKGLVFYAQDMPKSSYTLTPLDDETFNNFGHLTQLQIADKLLATLYFGYDPQTLQQKIDAGDFLEKIYNNLDSDRTDKAVLESYILDDRYFDQDTPDREIVHILTRFYANNSLDHYYFNNWIAYILTQTIMFSPAYELDSIHYPNIARTYNRIVSLLEEEASLGYLTYMHTISEDNWRRFRSPEDNGREMLEIFTQDTNDSHVPLAARALQNWSLDRDGDTLVVGLNENTQPIKLFDTTIYNGEDFYIGMVQYKEFLPTVVRRLIDYFFAQSSDEKKDALCNEILQSDPQTWQDIFKQIVFSKAYLLETARTKTAEESFFSFCKKTGFKHKRNTLYYFEKNLQYMHQASMKYKLGKLQEVPLDSLSFISYYKYFRDEVYLRDAHEDYYEDYNSWLRQGWSGDFVANDNFDYDYTNEEKSLESLINYVFVTMLTRNANAEEMTMFKAHMLFERDGSLILQNPFDMFGTREYRENHKRNIVKVVLDYIGRLDQLYCYSEVQE